MNLMNKWAARRAASFVPTAYLSGQLGEQDRFCIELPAVPLTIGRAAGANLRLHDSGVSRLHCEVWIDHGGHRIKDLCSKNGTWLNDWPVREAPLCEGDRIRVGNIWLTYGHTPCGRQLRVGDNLGVPLASSITTPLAQIAVHTTVTQVPLPSPSTQ